MAQYFFKIDISYTQKNKLYQAFMDHIWTLDATLITSQDALERFKAELTKNCHRLCEEYSRCKPILLGINKYSPGGDIEDVRVSGSFVAKIYKIKHINDEKDF